MVSTDRVPLKDDTAIWYPQAFLQGLLQLLLAPARSSSLWALDPLQWACCHFELQLNDQASRLLIHKRPSCTVHSLAFLHPTGIQAIR
jgi:hypothetical protein